MDAGGSRHHVVSKETVDLRRGETDVDLSELR